MQILSEVFFGGGRHANFEYEGEFHMQIQSENERRKELLFDFLLKVTCYLDSITYICGWTSLKPKSFLKLIPMAILTDFLTWSYVATYF